MPTCDLGYEHESAPEPEPTVVVEAEPGPNDNDVKIAEIEAEASIEREKIWTEAQENDLAQQNEALRGELRGIKETLATLAAPPPEPEPEPVPVPVPVPEPEPEPVAAPPETAPKPGGKKESGGWFSGYR